MPILYSLAKYPEIKSFTQTTVFEQLDTLTPFYKKNSEDIIKNCAQSSESIQTNTYIKDSFLRKKTFKRIFSKSKYLEAMVLENGNFYFKKNNFKINLVYLKNFNNNLDLYDLVTEENIFNTKSFHDNNSNSSAKSIDFSESLLIHCEFGDSPAMDPLRYRPEVGDLSNFEFPELLPALPGKPFFKN